MTAKSVWDKSPKSIKIAIIKCTGREDSLLGLEDFKWRDIGITSRKLLRDCMREFGLI